MNINPIILFWFQEIFQSFGKVADVKILRPNQKKAGAAVPYFSFVVFEEASAAAAAIHEKVITTLPFARRWPCLNVHFKKSNLYCSQNKITMKMSDGSNRRLNVEEKHARGDGSERSYSAGGYAPFPRGDSSNNIPGEREKQERGVGGGGGNNKSYGPRGGGNSGRGGNSSGSGNEAGISSSGSDRERSGGRNSGGGGGPEHRDRDRGGDRGHPRTHSRTFRGSNRGGGERGGGQTSGGGPGAR